MEQGKKPKAQGNMRIRKTHRLDNRASQEKQIVHPQLTACIVWMEHHSGKIAGVIELGNKFPIYHKLFGLCPPADYYKTQIITRLLFLQEQSRNVEQHTYTLCTTKTKKRNSCDLPANFTMADAGSLWEGSSFIINKAEGMLLSSWSILIPRTHYKHNPSMLIGSWVTT